MKLNEFPKGENENNELSTLDGRIKQLIRSLIHLKEK